MIDNLKMLTFSKKFFIVKCRRNSSLKKKKRGKEKKTSKGFLKFISSENFIKNGRSGKKTEKTMMIFSHAERTQKNYTYFSHLFEQQQRREEREREREIKTMQIRKRQKKYHKTKKEIYRSSYFIFKPFVSFHFELIIVL